MVMQAYIELPNGKRVDFPVTLSQRNRHVRLKFSACTGLSVSAPVGTPARYILELVSNRAQWITRQMERFASSPPAQPVPVLERPRSLVLPALGKTWQVEYRETPGKAVSARTAQPGCLIVSGATGNVAACQMALRRWLMRRARETLIPWLGQVARENGLAFGSVSVKNQRSRWGSCSNTGTISLNCKLLFLPTDLARYVLLHELCHTLERNHSSRYWALVRRLEPEVDSLRLRMREARRLVPAWV